METALAAADAFRIDDASCAANQFWANIHETGFLHGHTHIIIYIYTSHTPGGTTVDISRP